MFSFEGVWGLFLVCFGVAARDTQGLLLTLENHMECKGSNLNQPHVRQIPSPCAVNPVPFHYFNIKNYCTLPHNIILHYCLYDIYGHLFIHLHTHTFWKCECCNHICVVCVITKLSFSDLFPLTQCPSVPCSLQQMVWSLLPFSS